MPRRWRKDYPGAWHHVMNRGVARRTLFETGRDVRYFLACMARQVRAGDVEVHAYTLLTTHFHMLLRSPRGVLSVAMQRVLDGYARWFNRGRRRDGPLFRGRFTNRLVESESYWGNVVSYIDRNPVDAGLAARPSEYPHGSAFHYARRRGPPWLRRDVVESWTTGFADGVPYEPARYSESEVHRRGPAWLVARRMDAADVHETDPLDDLVGAAPPTVRDWMGRKARLGDGTVPGWVLVSPDTLGVCLDRRRLERPDWRADLGDGACAGWDVMEAGALRWFSGLAAREVSLRTGAPRSTCQERTRRFGRALRQCPEFRDIAADLLAAALAIDQGGTSRSRGTGLWKRSTPPPE